MNLQFLQCKSDAIHRQQRGSSMASTVSQFYMGWSHSQAALNALVVYRTVTFNVNIPRGVEDPKDGIIKALLGLKGGLPRDISMGEERAAACMLRQVQGI